MQIKLFAQKCWWNWQPSRPGLCCTVFWPGICSCSSAHSLDLPPIKNIVIDFHRSIGIVEGLTHLKKISEIHIVRCHSNNMWHSKWGRQSVTKPILLSLDKHIFCKIREQPKFVLFNKLFKNRMWQLGSDEIMLNEVKTWQNGWL